MFLMKKSGEQNRKEVMEKKKLKLKKLQKEAFSYAKAIHEKHQAN